MFAPVARHRSSMSTASVDMAPGKNMMRQRSKVVVVKKSVLVSNHRIPISDTYMANGVEDDRHVE